MVTANLVDTFGPNRWSFFARHADCNLSCVCLSRILSRASERTHKPLVRWESESCGESWVGLRTLNLSVEAYSPAHGRDADRVVQLDPRYAALSVWGPLLMANCVVLDCPKQL